jgi:hypothetical protein
MKLKDAARAFLRAVARVLRLLGRILHISLRVVGWLFVLAVLALGGLGCYAYRHFSPQETKRLAAEQLTSLLRREVVIDRLVLSPSGIKVLGLRVRRGGSEPDFLDCGSALVTVRLKPLLDKRVEIDKVRLEAPQIALLRDASGHWDVTDLFASTPTARGTEDETIPQMLATADVVVTDGVLRIDDREHGRTLNFEQLAMNFDRFSLKRAIPVQAAFVTRTRVGKRDIEARVSAEGSVDLASLNMSSASARVERFSGELQGVPLTGAVDIRGFLNPRVEGRFTAPPLAGEQWRRLFARDFPLTLPASRWRFKGGMPAAGMVDLQSVRVETDEGSAAASGVFDFAAADPTLSVEATFSDIPLGSVAERWPPWAKYALAGKATLRVDVTGWPGRLQAREADLSLHGFGATWGSRSVEGADLDLSATDEFAHVKATVFRGRVSAIGHVFDGVSGAAAIDGRALTVDRLVLNLEGAHLKLRGKMDKFFDPKGGAKVSAPKEVLLSGTADKIDWEKAAKFVLDVRAAISTRTATAADTEESKPWLRTFKYSIPRGFPNTTGSVKVGEIVHPNFTCKNLELLWSLHGITPELNKLNGEAYLSFGPGHVKDLATAQDANTFMRLVFLPFVYMYQMNGKAQLRSVYPKTFDFDRIDGEYGAANGVATIRYFHVGGPQFVAFAQGTADGGRETVDMNILTRLTSFSGLLPDFWLDELGRAAIGFSVKGDINKPDVEPRFKPKIGEKEIEQDVEAGRANAKKRFMALERRLNF